MTVFRSAIAAFGLVSIVLSGSVAAQELSTLTADDRMRLIFQNYGFNADTTLDEVKLKMLNRFRSTDIDGGGVSESDYRLRVQLDAAQKRTRAFERWLRKDLNGDGNVTRAELEIYFTRQARKPISSGGVKLMPTEAQVAQKLDKLVSDGLAADGNKDGVVSFAEALAAANEYASETTVPIRMAYRPVPLSLDEDGDGAVSDVEFERAVVRAFGDIDKNGNGILSMAEMLVLSDMARDLYKAVEAERDARVRDERMREATRSCGFPKAPDNATIVLLGAHRGAALSTVALGGDDEEVTVANAWIEQGKDPLYIVLTSSKAMIWQFTGAVDRVAFVVASSEEHDVKERTRVGVVGVPGAKVYISEEGDCLPSFWKPESDRATRAAALLPHLVGDTADVVVGGSSVSTVSLPVGLFDRTAVYGNAAELPSSGPGATFWNEMLRRHPGGLVQVVAAAVVSRSTAERYVTLPAEAGLAQLLDEGALRVIGHKKVVTIGGTQIVLGGGQDTIVAPEGVQPKVSLIPSKFLILKKIRFPAGLGGRHVVEFVLGPGVPEPDGSPGRATLTRSQ